MLDAKYPWIPARGLVEYFLNVNMSPWDMTPGEKIEFPVSEDGPCYISMYTG